MIDPVTLPVDRRAAENRHLTRTDDKAAPGVAVRRRPGGAYLSTDIQPASKKEVSKRSCTALACTRKDRPTRTAGNSPLCTRRYTVILLTRISAATSATVRNCVRLGSAAPVSRDALPPAESRAEGPFADVIVTHFDQARAVSAASPPLHPTRTDIEENSGTNGVPATGERQYVKNK